MLVAEMLNQTCQREPQKVALVFGGRRWTYAELLDMMRRVAGHLAHAGVQANDRVAFFMPNCPELLFSYLACFRLGAIAVPLNHRYQAAEAEYALDHSGSTTLLCHADKLDVARQVPLDDLKIERRFLIGGSRSEKGYQPFDTLQENATPAIDEPAFDDRQLATIMYTSGTTARPKGVVQSQRSLTSCARIQVETMQFTPQDVQLVTTSASHAAASYGQIFPNLLAGGTVVMLDGPTAEDVVRAIERERVTRCQMLPAGLQDFVEYVEAHPADLSSLRSFFSGGDVVPLDTHDRFRAVLGWDVTEVCGMTETITYAVNPPFGERRLGSVGKAASHTQIKIIDDKGQSLPAGETGEILIKSAENMVGYWNDTLSTNATLRDGWLASGDLGRLDADGYLWFVGRKKEIIIRGGSNISPAEVEEVIDEHPAVHISGVVGQPDSHWGQIVVAFVSLRSDVSPHPTEDELKAFVAKHISAYKVPERIIFLPELPLNSTGKVDRKRLHERLLAPAANVSTA